MMYLQTVWRRKSVTAGWQNREDRKRRREVRRGPETWSLESRDANQTTTESHLSISEAPQSRSNARVSARHATRSEHTSGHDLDRSGNCYVVCGSRGVPCVICRRVGERLRAKDDIKEA